MQNVLNQLVQHQTLTETEAEQAIYDIINGKLTNECITGLMVALQTRTITIDEVAGFRSALLSLHSNQKLMALTQLIYVERVEMEKTHLISARLLLLLLQAWGTE